MRNDRLAPILTLLTAVLFLQLFATSCQAELQTTPAPIKLGSWTSFSAIEDRGGKPVLHNWRISALDEKAELDHGVWMEMVDQREDSRRIYKMLVTLKDKEVVDNPLYFWDKIERLVIQSGTARPQEVRKELISRYLPQVTYGHLQSPGIQISESKPTKVHDLGKKQQEVAGKAYTCQHTKTERSLHTKIDIVFVKTERLSDQVINIWRAPDAPMFGVAKYTFEETSKSLPKEGHADTGRTSQLRVTVTLEGFGASGAKSEIAGKPEMLNKPSFPFAELGGKKAKEAGTPKPDQKPELPTGN